MLHMQKLYIHSYYSLVDFGALKEHIKKNIDDLVIFTFLGGQLVKNLEHFVTYLASGDKLWTIGDLGCK